MPSTEERRRKNSLFFVCCEEKARQQWHTTRAPIIFPSPLFSPPFAHNDNHAGATLLS